MTDKINSEKLRLEVSGEIAMKNKEASVCFHSEDSGMLGFSFT